MTEPAEKKPQHLKLLSFDELRILRELAEAASDLSFYNAATGTQYYSEGAARYKAALRYEAAVQAAHSIGFGVDTQDYCL